MKIVKEPSVYLIASTELEYTGIRNFFKDINIVSSVKSEEQPIDILTEMAGRLCYRSWEPYDPDKPEGTNPNVSKVRNDSEEYILNILSSGHGSVLEHSSMTFIARDISRVFTHELVRHRAGMAYSQESLRYVRLDDLRFWLPSSVQVNEEGQALFMEAIQDLENFQKRLQKIYDIVNIKDFSTKKKLTSMFRRLAPIGLSTSIMFTGNIRALRHCIQMRTSPAAEEEIRIVFRKVFDLCKERAPLCFQDAEVGKDGTEIKFKYGKV